MITEERLQEIKKRNYRMRFVAPYDTDIVLKDVEKLLTALENQGELLQLSLANVDRLNEELAEARRILQVNTSLRCEITENHALIQKQKAELEEGADRYAILHKQLGFTVNVLATLRKELADMQVERIALEHCAP